MDTLILGFLAFLLNMAVGAFMWALLDDEDGTLFKKYDKLPRWFAISPVHILVLELWPIGVFVWMYTILKKK